MNIVLLVLSFIIALLTLLNEIKKWGKQNEIERAIAVLLFISASCGFAFGIYKIFWDNSEQIKERFGTIKTNRHPPAKINKYVIRGSKFSFENTKFIDATDGRTQLECYVDDGKLIFILYIRDIKGDPIASVVNNDWKYSKTDTIIIMTIMRSSW